MHVAVDPSHPDNTRITDLQRALRDDHRLVYGSADVRLLLPVAPHGNQRLFLDVV